MAETLLKTNRFNVERHYVFIPGAGTVSRDLVVHPGAVAIIPLLSPDRLVMIRNNRFCVQAELLELPAGTLELAEEPIDCAARELTEETGYMAGQLEPLCWFYTSPGFTNERMYVFVGTNMKAGIQNLDPTERIRIQEMDLVDALEATLDGRIIDGKTIAALHAYHYRRMKRL